MKTYKVTGRTNGWVAQHDPVFKGKTRITFAEGKTLKEAHKILWAMFCNDYGFVDNWGLAVCKTRGCGFGAQATREDGTRAYDYDQRYYEIEEERA